VKKGKASPLFWSGAALESRVCHEDRPRPWLYGKGSETSEEKTKAVDRINKYTAKIIG